MRTTVVLLVVLFLQGCGSSSSPVGGNGPPGTVIYTLPYESLTVLGRPDRLDLAPEVEINLGSGDVQVNYSGDNTFSCELEPNYLFRIREILGRDQICERNAAPGMVCATVVRPGYAQLKMKSGEEVELGQTNGCRFVDLCSEGLLFASLLAGAHLPENCL